MKPNKTLAALVLASIAAVSHAGTTLTFEGIPDQTNLDTYDFGGGISTTGSVVSFTAFTSGGTANLASGHSGTNAIAIADLNELTTTASFRINVAQGFQQGVSLFSAGVQDDSGALGPISLSILDADDKELAQTSINFGQPSTQCYVDVPGQPDKQLALCAWSAWTLEFAGTAYAVRFEGTKGLMFFDDITLGTAATPPGGNVPEPGSLALLAVATGAAALTRRRKSSAR